MISFEEQIFDLDPIVLGDSERQDDITGFSLLGPIGDVGIQMPFFLIFFLYISNATADPARTAEPNGTVRITDASAFSSIASVASAADVSSGFTGGLPTCGCGKRERHVARIRTVGQAMTRSRRLPAKLTKLTKLTK